MFENFCAKQEWIEYLTIIEQSRGGRTLDLVDTIFVQIKFIYQPRYHFLISLALNKYMSTSEKACGK